jgi:cyclopropane fatty-acyl-phospholipid synthase-like methyltransferase
MENMKSYMDLGSYYVSDFVSNPEESNNRKKYSLDLVYDADIKAVRFRELAPPETMWGKYWYRSGINHSMKMELKSIVDEITKRIKLTDNDVWLDIACNDGTMFSFIPNNLIKLGIDPCDDSYYQESSKLAHCVIQEYFSKEAFQKTSYKDRKCKVVTSIAMFYDLEKPAQFISDIYDILEDDGVWVMQLSYTPLMIEQVAFDNICHEHTYYHSLNSIKILAEQQNMKVVDAEVNDANGGSIRVYIQKQIAKPQSFGNAHLRDVCKFRINSLLNYEDSKVDISDPNIWIEFHKKIDLLKKETVDFIRSEKAKGKIIAGYGASTKGNTLLQYFGLDSNDISFIAERSERKYGLLTVGTNIPIISEDEMRQRKPDYLLVLPWTFINEFIEREQEFLNQGGKFIVPCPQFEIIGK